jgi:hypothetical protein
MGEHQWAASPKKGQFLEQASGRKLSRKVLIRTTGKKG